MNRNEIGKLYENNSNDSVDISIPIVDSGVKLKISSLRIIFFFINVSEVKLKLILSGQSS